MSVEISKARALFDFLAHKFKLSREIGELNYKDVFEIVAFIESEQFKKLNLIANTKIKIGD